MRANWLCGRFCVQASSFENYIAEKAFTDRFVQQSHIQLKTILESLSKLKLDVTYCFFIEIYFTH